MGIYRSSLPRFQGKLPLTLFGGNFYGDFALVCYTKLTLKFVKLLTFAPLYGKFSFLYV